MSFGVTPKFPQVSITSGKILFGSFSSFIITYDQHMVNGSKIPVADAFDTSVTCFPIKRMHNSENSSVEINKLVKLKGSYQKQFLLIKKINALIF